MAIEFQCESLSSFDAATGRYKMCGAKIRVDDSKAGQAFNCPKCGSAIQVPSLQGSASGSGQRSASVGGDRHVSAGTEPAPSQAGNHAGAVGAASQGSAMQVDPDGQQLAVSRFDALHACKKCGTQVRPDMAACPSCGTPRRVVPYDEPLSKIQTKPAGFQLWGMSLLDSDNSWILIVGAMTFLLAFFSALAALVSVAVFHWFSILVIFPLTIVAAFYVMALLRIRAMSKKPGMPLYGWQKKLWNLVAIMQRTFNWQSPFRDRKFAVCNFKKQNLRGQDLLDLPGVETCQVLDLQGSEVTDDELKLLRYATNLRRLVLWDTKVTDEGVYRLQQAIPRVWIWY